MKYINTKYYGIFSEMNRINSAICIQRYWRLCRYNPEYKICEKVMTRNICSILDDNKYISIDYQDSDILFILRRKQKKFKLEAEKTRIFLDNYFKLQEKFKKRTILKPRRRIST